ncbi:MAG: type I restriction-modification system subunit M, partial [Clostridiales bacterium]|nr:type I restriction-modification system subunit M [Clostridiales bacterium]
MSNREIISKLRSMCDVLRGGGMTCYQYATELAYVLFLKMAKETGADGQVPLEYRWDSLAAKHGAELKRFYSELLIRLGEKSTGQIREMYANAQSNIDKPKNLEKIVTSIDSLDWHSAKAEGLSRFFEELLEEAAEEKESDARQNFTPQALINAMTELVAPKPGERCYDPSCGTFGFMVAADRYIKEHTDSYFDLNLDGQEFQKKKAFSGCGPVHGTHRLALMNAALHGIEGKVMLADALLGCGNQMSGFDVVLTNLVYQAPNRQLDFMQHIHRSLKRDGNARAAVVLPESALFEGRSFANMRTGLMDMYNLHTVRCLPAGLFPGLAEKACVLFFSRGASEAVSGANDRGAQSLSSKMP